MGKTNGKSEMKSRELDLEHELPPAEADLSEPRPAVSLAEAEISEVQKLRSERDALLDRLARSQAEFDNARKRATRDQQEYREYASAEAIKTLLPVIDNFERALSVLQSKSSEFRTGIELIYKQLQDVLQKLGVRQIDAKGEPFDPASSRSHRNGRDRRSARPFRTGRIAARLHAERPTCCVRPW